MQLKVERNGAVVIRTITRESDGCVCRLWSDGYLEHEWPFTGYIGYPASKQFVFILPYRDTNYTVTAMASRGQGEPLNSWLSYVRPSTLTTATGVHLQSSAWTATYSGGNGCLRVSGYIGEV